MLAALTVLWMSVPDELTVPWLPSDESAAIDRHRRPQDRASRTAARALLRSAVGGRLGVAPSRVELTRDPCLRCGGPHGRPVAPGSHLHLGVSHTDGLAAVVLSEAAPVGVDVEVVRPLAGGPTAETAMLAPAERHALLALEGAARLRAMLQTWVRKEATLKCTGHGLSVDPRQISVDPLAPGLQVCEGPEGSGPVYTRVVALMPSHVGAVASASHPADVEVTRLLPADLVAVGHAA